MTHTHDMSTYDGQKSHYAGVRARLGRDSIPPAVRLPELPSRPYTPAPVARRGQREYLFIRSDLMGRKKNGYRGIWRYAMAAEIVEEVSNKHGLTLEQVKGRGRSRVVVAARFEAFYRIHTELGYSLPMIGKALGGWDHTTVLHGIRKYKERNGL